MPRVSKAHALNSNGKLKKGCKWGSDGRPLCPGPKPKRAAKQTCQFVTIHGKRRVICWANTTASGISDNKPPKKKPRKKS